MINIGKNSLINYYLLNRMYEIHLAKEKILLFEKKYMMNFIQFEVYTIENSEDFEKWDDYLEWKANIKTLQSLEIQKTEISNGNYQIS